MLTSQVMGLTSVFVIGASAVPVIAVVTDSIQMIVAVHYAPFGTDTLNADCALRECFTRPRRPFLLF